MKRVVFPLIGAIVLGIGSPFMPGLIPNYTDPAGPLHVWFYLLTTAVDQWLLPESPVLMLALAMSVYAVQYLAVFALAGTLLPLAGLALDFIGQPRHRRGLIRR
jgi:hypothetical protein